MADIQEHIIKRFDEELNKLRFRLVKMGSLVQEQVEYAIRALTTNSTELAQIVIEHDDKVDKLDSKIDKQCLRIFALHQPMAMDLRLVMSAYSINDDMELIGDLSTNIAKNILDMSSIQNLTEETKLAQTGDLSVSLINKVLDSFIFSDVELAKQALKIASEIKNISKENFQLIIALMQKNPINISSGAYLIDINRNIQFISEQGRSIAQELIFLIEAKIEKHKKEEMADDIFGKEGEEEGE